MNTVKCIYNLMFDLYKMGRQECARNLAIGWRGTLYEEFAESMADALEASVTADKDITKKLFYLVWEEITQALKLETSEKAADVMITNFDKYCKMFPTEFINGRVEKAKEHKVLLNLAMAALTTPFIVIKKENMTEPEKKV